MSKVMFPNLQSSIFSSMKFLNKRFKDLKHLDYKKYYKINFYNNLASHNVIVNEKEKIIWIHGHTACTKSHEEIVKLVWDSLSVLYTKLMFGENCTEEQRQYIIESMNTCYEEYLNFLNKLSRRRNRINSIKRFFV